VHPYSYFKVKKIKLTVFVTFFIESYFSMAAYEKYFADKFFIE